MGNHIEISQKMAAHPPLFEWTSAEFMGCCRSRSDRLWWLCVALARNRSRNPDYRSA